MSLDRVKKCLEVLHEMYQNGLGGSHEAGKVREIIQEEWPSLSQEEIDEANKLAGELHQKRLEEQENEDGHNGRE